MFSTPNDSGLETPNTPRSPPAHRVSWSDSHIEKSCSVMQSYQSSKMQQHIDKIKDHRSRTQRQLQKLAKDIDSKILRQDTQKHPK